MIKFAVSLEHPGTVIFRIESNGKKMPIRWSSRYRAKLFGCALKIPGKTRTIIRNRTAREKERYRQGLPAKITEAYCLPQFICKLVVHQWMTRSRRVRVLSV